MELRDHAETMSLDGRSRGVMLDGVDPRTVRYLGLFPNLLLSLHPDYVLTHRMEPLAPGRTSVECEWLFPDAVTDPEYAVSFWDVTNRQDWAGVRIGAARRVVAPFPTGPTGTQRDGHLRLGHADRACVPGPRGGAGPVDAPRLRGREPGPGLTR